MPKSATSVGMPHQVADAIRRFRLAIQIAGAVLAAGGFAAIYWWKPTNLAAQIAAAVFGLSLVAFAQFFELLRKLKPGDRRTLELAGLGGAGLCIVAALGTAGFHIASRVPSGDLLASGGGATSDSKSTPEPTTQLVFSDKQPNLIVVRAPDPKKKWGAIIEVQQIWVLTPDTAAPAQIDWRGDASDVLLDVKRQTPFSREGFVGDEAENTIALQPGIPDALYETVDALSNKGQLKFNKPPQDYVFLLRVQLVEKVRAGKIQKSPTEIGQIVYFPDLKTGYNTPTSEANKEKLREIAALSFPKSAKLTKLLEQVKGGTGKP